jgi:hypothetical protein
MQMVRHPAQCFLQIVRNTAALAYALNHPSAQPCMMDAIVDWQIAIRFKTVPAATLINWLGFLKVVSSNGAKTEWHSA